MAKKSRGTFASLLKESVSTIPEYVPGKTTEQIAAEYGLDPETIVKLNSNENPRGPSKKAVAAIQKAVASASCYPSADASDLKKALVTYTGFPIENIVASGSGMDSIIDSLNKLFVGPADEVILPVPTFTYYGISAAAHGGTPVYVNRNSDFSIPVDEILSKVTDRTKIIYLCSPNNPTGNVLDRADVQKLAEKSKAIIFIDEAYVEFSSSGSLISMISEYENIVIGRTFSKAFGLAGLRIGYAVAPKWLASQLLRITPPFSVSILSEIAAIAALNDSKHLQKSVEMVQTERQTLVKAILETTPYKTWPTEGNFIIADVSPNTSKKAVETFLRCGVAVRSCDSFQNIGQNMIRITVGTKKMNRRVLKAFEVLKKEEMSQS
jgi:histidinol-phosphate aminotransferase